jgi:VWFA-related protein
MKKLFGAAGMAALIQMVAPAASAPQKPGSSADPFQISVNLNLVVLPVTVRDKKGGLPENLQQQDFEVFEDGTRQNIRLFRHEDIPVTAGLVIDHSGSMQKKMPDVLTAARTFVRLSNREDQMFVANFDERVTLGLPAARPFTNREEELRAAIEKAPVSGETALYDAIGKALDHLRTGRSEKKVLIVISDGGDNASTSGLPAVLKKADEAGAVIYAIGIYGPEDSDSNPGVLRRIAKETGGEAFFPEDSSQVAGICEGIAREIRRQYTIGYVPEGTRPSGRHAIRVTARADGRQLVVRTRAGYATAETRSEERKEPGE